MKTVNFGGGGGGRVVGLGEGFFVNRTQYLQSSCFRLNHRNRIIRGRILFRKALVPVSFRDLRRI